LFGRYTATTSAKCRGAARLGRGRTSSSDHQIWQSCDADMSGYTQSKYLLGTVIKDAAKKFLADYFVMAISCSAY